MTRELGLNNIGGIGDSIINISQNIGAIRESLNQTTEIVNVIADGINVVNEATSYLRDTLDGDGTEESEKEVPICDTPPVLIPEICESGEIVNEPVENIVDRSEENRSGTTIEERKELIIERSGMADVLRNFEHIQSDTSEQSRDIGYYVSRVKKMFEGLFKEMYDTTTLPERKYGPEEQHKFIKLFIKFCNKIQINEYNGNVREFYQIMLRNVSFNPFKIMFVQESLISYEQSFAEKFVELYDGPETVDKAEKIFQLLVMLSNVLDVILDLIDSGDIPEDAPRIGFNREMLRDTRRSINKYIVNPDLTQEEKTKRKKIVNDTLAFVDGEGMNLLNVITRGNVRALAKITERFSRQIGSKYSEDVSAPLIEDMFNNLNTGENPEFKGVFDSLVKTFGTKRTNRGMKLLQEKYSRQSRTGHAHERFEKRKMESRAKRFEEENSRKREVDVESREETPVYKSRGRKTRRPQSKPGARRKRRHH